MQATLICIQFKEQEAAIEGKDMVLNELIELRQSIPREHMVSMGTSISIRFQLTFCYFACLKHLLLR